MLELLFLLLPIAAGYGWFMGRNSLKQELARQQQDIQQAYSSGLNYLLKDQQDKAIEPLLNALQQVSDTADSHFTLALLFRRRGDLAKALKIHEYLAEHAELDDKVKGRARVELVEDYRQAGLLDRAEKTALSLMKSSYADKALRQLINIYQTTHEWHKAASLASKVTSDSDRQLKKSVANCICEAQAQQSQPSKAAYNEALTIFPQSLRAALAYADLLYLEKGEVGFAPYIRTLIQRHSANLLVICQHFNDSEARSVLAREVQQALLKEELKDNQAGLIIFKADYLYQEQGPAAAIEYVLKRLSLTPNIKVFSKLVEYQQQELATGNTQRWQLINQLLLEYQANLSPYQCAQCGYKVKEHAWQCPSCHCWETLVPVRGLEGE